MHWAHVSTYDHESPLHVDFAVTSKSKRVGQLRPQRVYELKTVSVLSMSAVSVELLQRGQPACGTASEDVASSLSFVSLASVDFEV